MHFFVLFAFCAPGCCCVAKVDEELLYGVSVRNEMAGFGENMIEGRARDGERAICMGKIWEGDHEE